MSATNTLMVPSSTAFIHKRSIGNCVSRIISCTGFMSRSLSCFGVASSFRIPQLPLKLRCLTNAARSGFANSINSNRWTGGSLDGAFGAGEPHVQLMVLNEGRKSASSFTSFKSCESALMSSSFTWHCCWIERAVATSSCAELESCEILVTSSSFA